MKEKYYSLEELFEMIDEPNKSSCKKIYLDNKEMFEKSKGSSVKHHTWEGGYLDHIKDSMNIAVRLHDSLSKCRHIPFSLSDSLLILYLHDLEKPYKYAGNEKQLEELKSFPDYTEFILSKVEEYKFQLTEEHLNAIKYTHGEGEDFDPKRKIQFPLAAFVHLCDTISARIWFNFPKNDSW